MNLIIEAILLSLALSADSFSAAMAMGFKPISRKRAWGFAIVSGLTEGLVTAFGIWGGKEIVSRFEAYDHWVAFFLLASISVHMAWEALGDLKKFKDPESQVTVKETSSKSHSTLWLFAVSFATSLDGLGLGISWGVLEKPVFFFLLFTIIWAISGTLLGLFLAKKLSRRFGARIHLASALLLALLSLKLLEI